MEPRFEVGENGGSVPLPPALTGSLPTRDDVLAQSIPFDPARWKRLLPDAAFWPPELDDCPVDGRWPRVDRRTVFEIGSRADDPLGATQLFVAASVWGVGTSARTVSRRARSFEQDVGGHLGLRLSKAIAVSRAMGPEAAYARLLRGGDLHVDRLGPSFFTKILYFATDDLRSIHRRPLILDQYVAASLNRAEIADWTLSEWSPRAVRPMVRTRARLGGLPR